MKLLVILVVIFSSAFAAELQRRPIAILRSANQMDLDGSYSYSYESEDGTKMQESGFQKRVGPKPEDVGTASSGSYSYVQPDGVTVTVNWTADENGFRATGDHLPVAPPMPDHVVKMLADLKAAGRL